MSELFKACIAGIMIAITVAIVAAIANIIVIALCYIVSDKDLLFKLLNGLKYVIIGLGLYCIGASLLTKL